MASNEAHVEGLLVKHGWPSNLLGVLAAWPGPAKVSQVRGARQTLTVWHQTSALTTSWWHKAQAGMLTELNMTVALMHLFGNGRMW